MYIFFGKKNIPSFGGNFSWISINSFHCTVQLVKDICCLCFLEYSSAGMAFTADFGSPSHGKKKVAHTWILHRLFTLPKCT